MYDPYYLELPFIGTKEIHSNSTYNRWYDPYYLDLCWYYGKSRRDYLQHIVIAIDRKGKLAQHGEICPVVYSTDNVTSLVTFFIGEP